MEKRNWKYFKLHIYKRYTSNNVFMPNTGYSLVELVVAIAILAIIGMSIFSLMQTATTQYTHQNSEVELQASAELLKNQMQTYILNADLGVWFENSSSSVTNFLPSMEGASACLVAIGSERLDTDTTVYNAGIIVWYEESDDTSSDSGNKIFYNELKQEDGDIEAGVSSDGTISFKYSMEKMSNIPSTWALLAEDVTNFLVDINDDNTVVTTHIAMKNLSASYSTSFNLALRNNTTYLADSGTITSNLTWSSSLGTKAKANKVTVSPSSTTAIKGETLAFSAAVTGTGYPSQTVTWSISSDYTPTSSETYIESSTGVLHIGQDETLKELEVVATNTDEDPISGSGYVSIATYEKLKITASNLTGSDEDDDSVSYTVVSGTSISFVASLVGSNMGSETLSPTWSVEVTSDQYDSISISSSGTVASLTVPLGMEEGDTIKVSASATIAGKTLTGSCMITIGEVTGSLYVTASSSTLTRGSSVSFSASVSDLSDDTQYSVEYEIYDDGGLGSLITLSGNTLYADSSISYSNSYSVSVLATATLSSTGTKIQKAATVSIKAVSITPASSAVIFTSTTAKASALTSSGYTYVGTAGVTTVSVPYTLTGIDSGTINITIYPSTSQVNVYESNGYIVIGTTDSFVEGSSWTVKLNINGESSSATTITVKMTDKQ